MSSVSSKAVLNNQQRPAGGKTYLCGKRPTRAMALFALGMGEQVGAFNIIKIARAHSEQAEAKENASRLLELPEDAPIDSHFKKNGFFDDDYDKIDEFDMTTDNLGNDNRYVTVIKKPSFWEMCLCSFITSRLPFTRVESSEFLRVNFYMLMAAEIPSYTDFFPKLEAVYKKNGGVYVVMEKCERLRTLPEHLKCRDGDRLDPFFSTLVPFLAQNALQFLKKFLENQSQTNQAKNALEQIGKKFLALQVGPNELLTPQVGPTELLTPQVGPTELLSPQVGPTELLTPQVGPTELLPLQVGPLLKGGEGDSVVHEKFRGNALLKYTPFNNDYTYTYGKEGELGFGINGDVVEVVKNFEKFALKKLNRYDEKGHHNRFIRSEVNAYLHLATTTFPDGQLYTDFFPKLEAVYEDEKSVYIVMQKCVGGSLHETVQKADYTQDDGLRWMKEANEAVSAMHAVGLAHLDIKLANFVLDEVQRLKLIDFGFVKAAGTFSKENPGDIEFVAPDLLARREYVPEAADLWSLAAMFKMVIRPMPFYWDLVDEYQDVAKISEAVQDHSKFIKSLERQKTDFFNHGDKYVRVKNDTLISAVFTFFTNYVKRLEMQETTAESRSQSGLQDWKIVEEELQAATPKVT